MLAGITTFVQDQRTLEERLHCYMHDDKCPRRVMICQERMLCIIIKSTELFGRELDQPTASIARAVSMASWSRQNTCPVGDFNSNKIVILVSYNAYVDHVVSPRVLHERVKKRLRDLTSFDSAFHVWLCGLKGVHVHFHMFYLVLQSALNVAIEARTDNAAVLAGLGAMFTVVSGIFVADEARTPRHGGCRTGHG